MSKFDPTYRESSKLRVRDAAKRRRSLQRDNGKKEQSNSDFYTRKSEELLKLINKHTDAIAISHFVDKMFSDVALLPFEHQLEIRELGIATVKISLTSLLLTYLRLTAPGDLPSYNAETINDSFMSALSAVDFTAKIAAGGIVGGFVGGPIGAVGGVGMALSTEVGATPLKTPKTSVMAKSSKKLGSHSQKTTKHSGGEIMGRYSVAELTIPSDRIFVATPNGGDYVLSLKGLTLLRDFLDPDMAFDLDNSQFSVISGLNLTETIKRNDYLGFQSIISKASKDLEKKFNSVEIIFRRTVGLLIDLVSSEIIPDSQEEMKNIIIEGIFKTTGIDKSLVRKAVVKSFNSYGRKIILIQDAEFQEVLKRNLRDIIFSRFTDETVMRKLFTGLKKNLKMHDSTSYDEAISHYRILETKGIREQNFEDRIEKIRTFVTNPDSQVIVVHPTLATKHKFNGGFTILHQRNIIVISLSTTEDSTVYPHEVLHAFDTEKCRVSEGMLRYLLPIKYRDGPEILVEPCGIDDNYKIDYSVGGKLFAALTKDLQILERRKVDSSTKEAIKHTFIYVKGNPAEIIPYATDRLTVNNLLGYLPNVSVIRSSTIIKDRPEAQLYAAMLQCDESKVVRLIKQNPSILESKYDGIPLNQLPEKLLTTYQYDIVVDRSFIISKKENCYSTVNQYVKKEYEKYQAAKKADRSGAEL